MRALTIRQPYAWAIIHGGKNVENRTRNIVGDFKGLVAIHAAQKPTEICELPDRDHPLWPPLVSAHKAYPENREIDFERFAYGAVIGVAEIVGSHMTGDTLVCRRTQGRAMFGKLYTEAPSKIRLVERDVGPCSPWADMTPGMWHIELANPIALPEPVPCRGRLGLWTLPEHVAARVTDQLKPLKENHGTLNPT